jgi:hypothetical protein
MKRNLIAGLSLLCAISVWSAENSENGAVKAAAEKLGGKGSYAWTLLSKPETGEGFRMEMDGKTDKGGFTLLTLTFGDNKIEAVRSASKIAVLRDGEWKTPEDMEEREARMARRFQEMKLPVVEAAELADKAGALKTGEEGLYSGDLTEQGVKELFARWRRGGQGAEAKDAKGWVKFWVKDGVLAKYQYNTKGKIAVGQDQNEMEIDRTTTVDLKDAGATKVTVPDGARKKLQ